MKKHPAKMFYQAKLRAAIFFFLLCAAFFCSAAKTAFPSDKSAPAELSADSADFSQISREGSYLGHVHFKQGKMEIEAAKLLTRFDEHHQLIFAKAEGDHEKRAHFWSQPGDNQPPFHAYAHDISYIPLENLIELKGEVFISQGKHCLRSEKISYNLLTQHVFSPANKSQTIIMIYPEKDGRTIKR